MRDTDLAAVKRLADYEDTGLTPDEVDQIRRASLTMMFPTVGDFVRYAIQNFEDLEKYRKAESEGRLIILPEHWKDLCGRKGMQLYTIFQGDVYDAEVTDVYIDENGEGRFAYAIFPSEDPFDSEWLDKPVSRFWDVLFRTYEEAEAALAKEAHNDT